MEQVSLKVAKAIKEAGYPQDYKNDDTYTNLNGGIWAKPTYIEVWLWLWRQKKMTIDVVALAGCSCGAFIWKFGEHLNSQIKFEDPEKAIIKAIEYLVDNSLLK